MANPHVPLAPGPRLVQAPPPGRHRWKLFAVIFAIAAFLLAGALAASWMWFRHLALQPPQAVVPTFARPKVLTPGPVTPLLLQYKLDLPGRGEIFPAMSSAAREYWSVAILTISNSADRPALQIISAHVAGWTDTLQESLVVAPGETRVVKLSPGLLPRAYQNAEVRRATLDVRVTGDEHQVTFAESRPVLLHGEIGRASCRERV